MGMPNGLTIEPSENVQAKNFGPNFKVTRERIPFAICRAAKEIRKKARLNTGL